MSDRPSIEVPLVLDLLHDVPVLQIAKLLLRHPRVLTDPPHLGRVYDAHESGPTLVMERKGRGYGGRMQVEGGAPKVSSMIWQVSTARLYGL